MTLGSSRELRSARSLIALLPLTLVALSSAGISLTSAADAPDPASTPPMLRTVKGDILNIEGEQVVVKDQSGHEVRLQISKDTRADRLKVGDKVTATVKPDGHADSVEVQTP